jgi:hypothetical protein
LVELAGYSQVVPTIYLTEFAQQQRQSVSNADQFPVPMSGRTCGLPDAESTTVTLPCLIPIDAGLKLTVT